MQISTLKEIVSEHEKLQERIDTLWESLQRVDDMNIAGHIKYLGFRTEQGDNDLVQLTNPEIGVQDFVLFLAQKISGKIELLKKRQEEMLREIDL